jgi:SOS response regulatory protein OraA/RecX
MTPRTPKTNDTQALELLARYLTLRDHSRQELCEKLIARFGAKLISELMAEADRRGWLLPEDEIAQRAALTWERKLKGRGYIEEQLRKRGLPLPPVNEEAELVRLRDLVLKKFGEPSTLSMEVRAKAFRFLTSRGFEERTIRMVFHAEF